MRILTFILGFVVAFTAGAEVYRGVDENGNVEYSDKTASGSKKITLGDRLTTYGTDAAKKQEEKKADGEGDDKKDAETEFKDYKKFKIVSPGGLEKVRGNGKSATIKTVLEPALVAEHKIEIVQNGKKLAQKFSSTSFILALERQGTHSVYAQVVDSAGKMLIRSNVVAFVLQTCPPVCDSVPGFDHTKDRNYTPDAKYGHKGRYDSKTANTYSSDSSFKTDKKYKSEKTYDSSVDKQNHVGNAHNNTTINSKYKNTSVYISHNKANKSTYKSNFKPTNNFKSNSQFKVKTTP